MRLTILVLLMANRRIMRDDRYLRNKFQSLWTLFDTSTVCNFFLLLSLVLNSICVHNAAPPALGFLLQLKVNCRHFIGKTNYNEWEHPKTSVVLDFWWDWVVMASRVNRTTEKMPSSSSPMMELLIVSCFMSIEMNNTVQIEGFKLFAFYHWFIHRNSRISIFCVLRARHVPMTHFLPVCAPVETE